MRATLHESVDVGVPADTLWDVVTDWPAQGDWIPWTRVGTTSGSAGAVGDGLQAWTGIGRLGLLDTMVITHWDAPATGRRVCEVIHTGRVVRGEGGFEVEPIDAARSRFVWWETFELPLGPVGAALWRALGPWWRAGTGRALQRLRVIAEGESPGG